MSLRVRDDQLARFADIYKSVLNTHDGRVAAISRDDYSTITVYPDGESFTEGPENADRVSVQFIFDEEESHWVSLFRGESGAWQLFDPALPGNVYPLPQPHRDFLRQRFGRYVKFRAVSPLQVDDTDTWCQSWSLAMLDANYQGRVTEMTRRPGRNKAEKQSLVSDIVESYAGVVRVPFVGEEDSRFVAFVLSSVDLKRSFYRFYSDQVSLTVTPFVRRKLPRDYSAAARLFHT